MRSSVNKIIIFFLFLCLIIPINCSNNKYDPDILTQKEKYNLLFDHNNLHEIELKIKQSEWDILIEGMNDYKKIFNSYRYDGYIKTQFIYKGPLGNIVLDDVGLRTKGLTTRKLPQHDDGSFHRANFKIRIVMFH